MDKWEEYFFESISFYLILLIFVEREDASC